MNKDKEVLKEVSNLLGYSILEALQPEEWSGNSAIKFAIKIPKEEFSAGFLLQAASSVLNIYEELGVNIFTYSDEEIIKNNAAELLRSCMFVCARYSDAGKACQRPQHK